MKSWTVFLSGAVFVVWMQRKGRWSDLSKAMTGTLVVSGTPAANAKKSNG